MEDETGVEERLETARRIAPVNGLYRVEPNESGEDPECAKHVLGVVFEEVVAPVDRGTEGALPVREIRGVPGQKGKTLAQSLRRAAWSEHADACSGELDGQRQPVDRSTDLRDCGCVVVPELERWDRRAHALDVEPDGIGTPYCRRRSCVLIGNAERGYAVLVLDGQPERDATRCQHSNGRACGQKVGDDRMRSAKVFEVVEDEQRRTGERGLELPGDRGDGRLLRPDCGGGRGQDVLRIRQRSEIDKDSAADFVCCGERQPRLSDTTRAGERHQAGFGPT